MTMTMNERKEFLKDYTQKMEELYQDYINELDTIDEEDDEKILYLKKFIYTWEELNKISIKDRQLILVHQAAGSYKKALEWLECPLKNETTFRVMCCKAKREVKNKVLKRLKEENYL